MVKSKNKMFKIMMALIIIVTLPTIALASMSSSYNFHMQTFTLNQTTAPSVSMTVDVFATSTCSGTPIFTDTCNTDVNGVCDIPATYNMTYNTVDYACIYANGTLLDSSPYPFTAGQGQIDEFDVEFTNLNITNDLNVGNDIYADNIEVTGDIETTGGVFYGDGSGLTNLPASAQYWNRTGTTLFPATLGDEVVINATGGTALTTYGDVYHDIGDSGFFTIMMDDAEVWSWVFNGAEEPYQNLTTESMSFIQADYGEILNWGYENSQFGRVNFRSPIVMEDAKIYLDPPTNLSNPDQNTPYIFANQTTHDITISTGNDPDDADVIIDTGETGHFQIGYQDGGNPDLFYISVEEGIMEFKSSSSVGNMFSADAQNDFIGQYARMNLRGVGSAGTTGDTIWKFQDGGSYEIQHLNDSVALFIDSGESINATGHIRTEGALTVQGSITGNNSMAIYENGQEVLIIDPANSYVVADAFTYFYENNTNPMFFADDNQGRFYQPIVNFDGDVVAVGDVDVGAVLKMRNQTGTPINSGYAWFNGNDVKFYFNGGLEARNNNMTADYFIGDGSQLTNLPVSAQYWNRSGGVIYPATLNDDVQIDSNSAMYFDGASGNVFISHQTSPNDLVIEGNGGIQLKDSEVFISNGWDICWETDCRAGIYYNDTYGMELWTNDKDAEQITMWADLKADEDIIMQDDKNLNIGTDGDTIYFNSTSNDLVIDASVGSNNKLLLKDTELYITDGYDICWTPNCNAGLYYSNGNDMQIWTNDAINEPIVMYSVVEAQSGITMHNETELCFSDDCSYAMKYNSTSDDIDVTLPANFGFNFGNQNGISFEEWSAGMYYDTTSTGTEMQIWADSGENIYLYNTVGIDGDVEMEDDHKLSLDTAGTDFIMWYDTTDGAMIDTNGAELFYQGAGFLPNETDSENLGGGSNIWNRLYVNRVYLDSSSDYFFFNTTSDAMTLSGMDLDLGTGELYLDDNKRIVLDTANTSYIEFNSGNPSIDVTVESARYMSIWDSFEIFPDGNGNMFAISDGAGATGQLTYDPFNNRLELLGGTTNPYLQLDSNMPLYLDGSGNSVFMQYDSGNGWLEINGGGNDVRFDASAVPISDTTYNLGGPTVRWGNLYSQDATIGNTTDNINLGETGLTMNGLARVNKTIGHYAYNMYGMIGTYGGFPSCVASGLSSVNEMYLLRSYDDNSGAQDDPECSLMTLTMPTDYEEGTNYSIELEWTALATTGTVEWVVCVVETGIGESFTTTETCINQSDTAPATSYYRKSFDMEFDGTNVEKDDEIGIIAMRLGNNDGTNDTMTGDALLSSLHLHYVANSLGD